MSWRFKFGACSCSFSLGLLLSLSQSLAVMSRSMAQIPSAKAGAVEQSCTDEQIDTWIRWWHINNLSIRKKLSACSESATPHLIQVLITNQDVWRRQNAARFLGELKSIASTQALMNAIQSDQNETVRQYAAVSLVQINGPETIETLFLDTLLINRSTYSRAIFVDVFSKLPTPEVLPSLVAALSNQSLDVRYLAVEILANSRSELAMQALEQHKAIVSSTLEQREKVASRRSAHKLWYESSKVGGISAQKTQGKMKKRIPPMACRWDWFAKMWQSC
jgi:hypothetical protein